jgi:hypothetical protein
MPKIPQITADREITPVATSAPMTIKTSAVNALPQRSSHLTLYLLSAEARQERETDDPAPPCFARPARLNGLPPRTALSNLAQPYPVQPCSTSRVVGANTPAG